MAYDDEDFPSSWNDQEKDLYDDLVGGELELIEDEHLQMLYHAALFDLEIDGETRAHLTDNLIDYLWDEYGIDFDADFDWIEYREWYDSQ